MILDWVPAHFPRDEFALARFDGTALYEHDDPRRGAHPDWGTLVFNYGRTEVRNFLLASALFWLREYHADGLRVDAVASMLYLDYSRREGEWIPNAFGGREDLDAVAFLQELNEVVHGREPGVDLAAEESTAWPGVSRPTYVGGLGFGFKWNMGWMHDTLDYFDATPFTAASTTTSSPSRSSTRSTRTSSCRCRTTRSCTARARCSRRCPATAGSSSRTCARCTATCGRIPARSCSSWAASWRRSASGAQADELARLASARPPRACRRAGARARPEPRYRDEPALWEVDFEPAGFRWLELNDAAANVLAFMRASRADGTRKLVCIVQPLAGAPRALPRRPARRRQLARGAQHRLAYYGGSGMGNLGAVVAQERPWHGQPFSAE